MRHLMVLLLVACVGVCPALAQQGGEFVEDQPNSTEGDSTFDPFSDYSEFEEGSEEEADVNFFHNGRFFTLGMTVGHQSFTEVLGLLYKPTLTYGLFLSYFFDLRFAIQVSYLSADHKMTIQDGTTAREYNGKAAISHFDFDFKYYLNTQNVTRGLAALNPYLIAGIGQYTRTYTFDGISGFARDSSFGIHGGAGIEIPMLHNKMFFGAQGTYRYISFPDKNAPIVINGAATNIMPTGDAITLVGLLGVNF